MRGDPDFVGGTEIFLIIVREKGNVFDSVLKKERNEILFIFEVFIYDYLKSSSNQRSAMGVKSYSTPPRGGAWEPFLSLEEAK